MSSGRLHSVAHLPGMWWRIRVEGMRLEFGRSSEWVGRGGGWSQQVQSGAAGQGRGYWRSHPAGAGPFSLHQPQQHQEPLCGSRTCSWAKPVSLGGGFPDPSGLHRHPQRAHRGVCPQAPARHPSFRCACRVGRWACRVLHTPPKGAWVHRGLSTACPCPDLCVDLSLKVQGKIWSKWNIPRLHF